MEFSLDAALSPGRLKPELRTHSVQVWSSGMEFSLQAALSSSRLKPELRTHSVQVWSSGMESSLQAALSPGRLKPELRTDQILPEQMRSCVFSSFCRYDRWLSRRATLNG